MWLVAALPAAWPATLFSTRAMRFSICVAHKAAMTQWNSLFPSLANSTTATAQPCTSACPALPSDMLRAPMYCGSNASQCLSRIVVDSKRWPEFYNLTGNCASDFLHVHVIREPVERLVSSFLDRCVRKKIGWCASTGKAPDLHSFRNFFRVVQRRANASGTGLARLDEHFRSQTADCNSVLLRGPREPGTDRFSGASPRASLFSAQHVRLMWQSHGSSRSCVSAQDRPPPSAHAARTFRP